MNRLTCLTAIIITATLGCKAQQFSATDTRLTRMDSLVQLTMSVTLQPSQTIGGGVW